MPRGWIVDGGWRNLMRYRVGAVDYRMERVSSAEMDNLHKKGGEPGRPLYFCQTGNDGSFRVWPQPAGGGVLIRHHV